MADYTATDTLASQNNLSGNQAQPASDSTSITVEGDNLTVHYLMRANDLNCGTLTYRTWVTTNTPDLTGASYSGAYCGGSLNLSNIVIADTWEE